MIEIFGIKNCDTMKKAFRWLDANNFAYTFHDYKKEGLDEATAKAWVDKLGWENIINKTPWTMKTPSTSWFLNLLLLNAPY
jgi:arsenate reductase-like glutaredoxin family protein